MSSIVLATHDYGQGGIAMLVRCENTEDLKMALGDKWDIISENVADHPFWKNTTEAQHVVHDFSKPAGLLEAMLYVSARESEGKRVFPIRVGPWGRFQKREVWAKSKEEVEETFPNCKFLFGEILTLPMDRSDIDVPDEFIRKYGRKYT